MSDAELEDLQIRVAHQEMAIEALNKTVARQDVQLGELGEEIRRLKALLRDINLSPLGNDGGGQEPPPPHY